MLPRNRTCTTTTNFRPHAGSLNRVATHPNSSGLPWSVSSLNHGRATPVRGQHPDQASMSTPITPTTISTSPTMSQFTAVPATDRAGRPTAKRRIAPLSDYTIENPNPMTKPPFASEPYPEYPCGAKINRSYVARTTARDPGSNSPHSRTARARSNMTQGLAPGSRMYHVGEQQPSAAPRRVQESPPIGLRRATATDRVRNCQPMRDRVTAPR